MTDPIEDFWLASQCTRLTQRQLVDRLRDWTPGEPVPDRYAGNGALHPLPRPDDELQRLLAGRRSGRRFGRQPLTERQLGWLLGALAGLPDGRRPHPSAGGLNALQAHLLLLDVEHPLGGRAVRYDPVAHALQDAGQCPPWESLAPLLGVAPEPDGRFAASSRPQVVLVLAIDDRVLLDKYGRRGGRFGLVEIGAAAQSVALRLAADGLAGYLLGGAVDDEVLALLGLRLPGVRLGAVMACGHPPESAPRGPLRWLRRWSAR